MERRGPGRPPHPDPGRYDQRTYTLIHTSTIGMSRIELAALVGVTPDKMYEVLCRLRLQGRIEPPSNNRSAGRWTAAGPPRDG